jgi:hypothetical protein
MSGVQRTSRIAGPTGNEGKFSVTPMHMVQFVTLLAQGTMCGGVAEFFFPAPLYVGEHHCPALPMPATCPCA